jgi:hypothetical protein
MGSEAATWSVPYIDQPPAFWEALRESFGDRVSEVYFPLRIEGLGSGRPSQPSRHLGGFLEGSPFRLSALVNPIVLGEPVEEISPRVVDELARLSEAGPLVSATVANVELAARIRSRLPRLTLVASTLMDICGPGQLALLDGLFDVVVPSSRIMRDLPALRSLRRSFKGRLRIIVNEGCLPGCPFRVQHFFEMARDAPNPKSLCRAALKKDPWLRLTGSWVLPQHLGFYDGLYDELKLDGRVTLADPGKYVEVLSAYIRGGGLTPDRIGGGPASLLWPLRISDEFYERTLACTRDCARCGACRDYFAREMPLLGGSPATPGG